jgi:L-alanine-DL-glutamate epimerase-like enolase superfamily enzyme
MIIKKIEVWDFRPPFRDGPYEMANDFSQSTSFGRILKFTVANESQQEFVGFGEIVYTPYAELSVIDDIIIQEKTFLAKLVGEPLDSIRSLVFEISAREKAWRGVGFGLETALFDILSRQEGLSLADYLGGVKSNSVDGYFSISERDLERVSSRMKISGHGRKVIQLKIAVGSVDDDVNQIHAVLAHLNENQLVLADANNGRTVSETCWLIDQFDDERIIWEEPCASYEENCEVSEKTGKPIMFDQCVGSYEMALRAINDGVAGSICIKPAFIGGLSAAKDVRDQAIKVKLPIRIDGPWCGDIASAAALHLAIGTPPELLIAGCDLREPMVIVPDLKAVHHLPNCRIAPHLSVGLGLSDASDKLGPADSIYA